MALFDIFKKKSKKEEKAMTQDEKELEKAKEDIAKKGADSKTERDREDESVAAQERESGTEDSQSAKDRIDESEGAKKADEKREEEKDDSVEDKLGAVFSRFESKLDQLIAKLDTMTAKETVEEKAEEVVEEKAEEVYGLGNGVFQGEVAEEKVEKMSPAEVAKVVRSLKK